MSTPEPRQWYKNSERPVTEDEAKKGILCTWPDGPVDRYDFIPFGLRDPDAYWMPDDIPPLPKPKEKTQAEKDVELWNRRFDSFDFDKGLSKFAAAIRADQEAKTKAELGKKVEEWIDADSANYDDLRAIFAQPTTPTKGTP